MTLVAHGDGSCYMGGVLLTTRGGSCLLNRVLEQATLLVGRSVVISTAELMEECSIVDYMAAVC